MHKAKFRVSTFLKTEQNATETVSPSGFGASTPETNNSWGAYICFGTGGAGGLVSRGKKMYQFGETSMVILNLECQRVA